VWGSNGPVRAPTAHKALPLESQGIGDTATLSQPREKGYAAIICSSRSLQQAGAEWWAVQLQKLGESTVEVR
jgi:hypothetical protein